MKERGRKRSRQYQRGGLVANEGGVGGIKKRSASPVGKESGKVRWANDGRGDVGRLKKKKKREIGLGY